jgi:hypothetical protein
MSADNTELTQAVCNFPQLLIVRLPLHIIQKAFNPDVV